jgi:uncharacterized glyoxalase superfamily protein PhnB
MKPPPPDWPRLSSSLFYDDAPAAIRFLQEAFGFELRLCVEADDGRVQHSELVYGGAVVMVGSASLLDWATSPRGSGRNTQCLFLYVEDADAHCARARAAGAQISMEPSTSDYGPEYWSDRNYQAVDPEGHRWYFAHRVRDPLRP